MDSTHTLSLTDDAGLLALVRKHRASRAMLLFWVVPTHGLLSNHVPNQVVGFYVDAIAEECGDPRTSRITLVDSGGRYGGTYRLSDIVAVQTVKHYFLRRGAGEWADWLIGLSPAQLHAAFESPEPVWRLVPETPEERHAAAIFQVLVEHAGEDPKWLGPFVRCLTSGKLPSWRVHNTRDVSIYLPATNVLCLSSRRKQHEPAANAALTLASTHPTT